MKKSTIKQFFDDETFLEPCELLSSFITYSNNFILRYYPSSPDIAQGNNSEFMKNLKLIVSVLAIITFLPVISFGQLKTTIENGMLRIEDGSLYFYPKKYSGLVDSLNNRIIKHPNDTTALFELALILDLSNNQMSKPAFGDKSAFVNLLHADSLVHRTAKLGMRDVKLKILCAQVYRDLTYRFAGDERWKFSAEEISRRRSAFNKYKDRSNQIYNSLASEDPTAANDYRKLMVKVNYPISN